MRRLLVLALAALALVAGPAPGAVAGGPTSVLAVNYDGSRASAALTGSAAYERLSQALDIFASTSGTSTEPAGIHRSDVTRVRLTWFIHDVNPWRVDAVTLVGDQMWVGTQTTMSENEIGSSPVIWHRPADADLLLRTLTELGVAGPARDTPRTAAATPATTVTVTAAAPRLAPAADEPATEAEPRWVLLAAISVTAIVGLAAGFALARRGERGRRSRRTAPEAEWPERGTPRPVL